MENQEKPSFLHYWVFLRHWEANKIALFNTLAKDLPNWFKTYCLGLDGFCRAFFKRPTRNINACSYCPLFPQTCSSTKPSFILPLSWKIKKAAQKHQKIHCLELVDEMIQIIRSKRKYFATATVDELYLIIDESKKQTPFWDE